MPKPIILSHTTDGGTYRRSTVENYDASALLGLEKGTAVIGEVSIYACSKCGEQLIDAETIGQITGAVALEACKSPRRLSGRMARVCRDYLGLLQKELAERMGVVRKTVNRWEADETISPQNDYILRSLVLNKAAGDQLGVPMAAVRTEEPEKRTRLRLAEIAP